MNDPVFRSDTDAVEVIREYRAVLDRWPVPKQEIEVPTSQGATFVLACGPETAPPVVLRRLAEIPTEDWNDVRVDITPREYVLDYLAHSFPVQLYEPFSDGEGNLSSRPVYRDGHGPRFSAARHLAAYRSQPR
jgi:hypothetical protein